MKKLVWQYNVKTSRSYDRGFPEIARLSTDTVARYAGKIGADHMVETRPTLFDENRNFPGVDFFTFFRDRRYDDYDFVIKFDADFLVGPGFPDLSLQEAEYVGLKGYGWDAERDRWRDIHERTWRNFGLDRDRWRENYVMVGMAGMSQAARQWIGRHINDRELDLLVDCRDTVMVHQDRDFRWSVTEQSYINYLLYHAPFSRRTLSYPPLGEDLVYHAGPRTDHQLRRYRQHHRDIVAAWESSPRPDH